MSLKTLIPASMRVRYQLWKRHWKDWRSGQTGRFAGPGRRDSLWAYSIETRQIVRPSHLFENKIDNINLAGKSINEVVVQPGEVFSFWRVIGNPSARNGYKTGRNLVNGTLTESSGGGLCQLSGIIYHTALKAGLEVMERHNHSVDIYEEDQRFCPLGSDATVVYGYKDLRLVNTSDSPIAFHIRATKENVLCQLQSKGMLKEREIEFHRQVNGSAEVVTTQHMLNGHPQTLTVSTYRRKQASPQS